MLAIMGKQQPKNAPKRVYLSEVVNASEIIWSDILRYSFGHHLQRKDW